MIPNELLQYYESVVRDLDPIPNEENCHLHAYISEIRDLWEKRVILRELRLRTGLPVCSGEVDCLGQPTSHCMHADHPTCPDHTDSCFLCVPISRLR